MDAADHSVSDYGHSHGSGNHQLHGYLAKNETSEPRIGARWIMLGLVMAIQENGLESIDYFALLRGWTPCRQDLTV